MLSARAKAKQRIEAYAYTSSKKERPEDAKEEQKQHVFKGATQEYASRQRTLSRESMLMTRLGNYQSPRQN